MKITSDRNIPWADLRDATVLITGATGFIGTNLVRALSFADKEFGLNMRVIGHGRDAHKCGMLSRGYGVECIAGDIRRPLISPPLPGNADYIIHCAAVTKSAEMISDPSGVAGIMTEGTQNALNFAAYKQCRSFVYLSSMEVYGQTSKYEVAEDDLGYLDLSNPRSCYPESKRQCERLCLEHVGGHGLNVKIARLAMIFGAGTDINIETDTRAPYQFARKAAAGVCIELHTQGNSITNCCHTNDAVRGILTVMLKGRAGEIYNISNPETCMTIREMAHIAAGAIGEYTGKVVDVVVRVPDDIELRGYAPDSGFKLNIDKIKGLGWTPEYGLRDMFRHMME